MFSFIVGSFTLGIIIFHYSSPPKQLPADVQIVIFRKLLINDDYPSYGFYLFNGKIYIPTFKKMLGLKYLSMT